MMDDLIAQYEGRLPGNILRDFKKEATARTLNSKQAEKVLAYLEEQYNKAKIHAGEAIGVITAESFGEPGTQMSTSFDTPIIVRVNGKVEVVKIGGFIDRLMEYKGTLALDAHSEVLPLHDLDIFVPSLNEEEKIEWKKVVECSRHKSPAELLKITTASGREIICTDNHSFVTRSRHSVVPICGKDLRVGDRIPVLNNFFVPSPLRELSLHTQVVYSGYVDEEGMLQETYPRTKPIKNFIPLDSLTGWFIGAYLAEGSANHGNGVSISNISEPYINNASLFGSRLMLDGVDMTYMGEYGSGGSLTFNSTLLGKFISLQCGDGSSHKRVPRFAYTADDDFVAGLLRGYFDGDSSFHVARKMIRVSSNSKELVDGIALLLNRFRIFSYKIRDRKQQYWLLIPYKYAPTFLARIGSDIPYKKQALEQLAERAKHLWDSYSLDYTDMISGFDDLFYTTAKKLHYPTRYVNNFTKSHKIGRTNLYRYIHLFEKLAKERGVDITRELELMKRMFYSDVIWDEIVSLTYVKSDSPYVYDLSVPGLETFTTGEGLITHNTLNVFHFAGVAEVSVTQGLPRLIEILDARKEISTPSMEIYLKPDYHKDPKEVKRIAGLIKETTLGEIASSFSINLNKLQIEIEMDKAMMRDLKITDEYVEKKLSESLKNVKVKRQDHLLVLKVETEENEVMETYKLKEKIKDMYIRGVKGITQVLPVKSDSEFIIITSGSNLKDVMQIDEVDETRTITNDVFEVLSVLGVEAARQVIINEATKVIEDQGLDVDIRHIMLVADAMTTTGNVKGITRGGITGEKKSVLARASFETPMKHLVHASLIGEEDELSSVIENVMLNQPVPVGTGLPGLVAKMRELFSQAFGQVADSEEKIEKKEKKE